MTEDILPALEASRVPRASTGRGILSWLWAGLPLLFALPAPLSFGWAAWRLRSGAVAVEAAGYLAACVGWVALTNQTGEAADVGAAVAVTAAGVAFTRAVMLRRSLFYPAPVAPAVAPLQTSPATSQPPWHPVFPAQKLPARDPNDPSTWVSAVACNGADRHQLSVPTAQAALAGVAGLLLVALDIRLHVYGRGLGYGIGLLMMPLFAALFARWVEGPILNYRVWGTLHELRLDSVTAVATAKPARGAATVLLTAPGLDKPLRLSLRTKAFAVQPAAKDHLAGWLGNPSVEWSPTATAMFSNHTPASTARTRSRYRVIVVVLGVVLPLALVAVQLVVNHERSARSAIPGASAYHRPYGPDGRLIAVGRPWGRACQPVRFSVEEHVPDWVYRQIVSVVAEGRRDGLNITLEARDFMWYPASVYYPAGMTPANVERVGIFWHTETPPSLPGGGRQHIRLGYDAARDLDGKHDDLTLVNGDLWMQTLGTNAQAVRRSVRQLIAITQGIVRTSRKDSGIAVNTANDRFSPADIAAMKLMSGCGNAATPTVAGNPYAIPVN